MRDADVYKTYVAANAEAVFSKYGGRNFWCAAAGANASKGEARARNVVIEFYDFDTALACFRSPEYAKAMALRLPVATVDVVVAEGYDGPQP